MRPIPPTLRKEMSEDPFYKRCCFTGRSNEKIDWHHAFVFAGRQVNEKWCILPLCKTIHDMANNKSIKAILDWIILSRATDADLKKYSKAVDLIRIRSILNEVFGLWIEGLYPEKSKVLTAKYWTHSK